MHAPNEKITNRSTFILVLQIWQQHVVSFVPQIHFQVSTSINSKHLCSLYYKLLLHNATGATHSKYATIMMSFFVFDTHAIFMFIPYSCARTGVCSWKYTRSRFRPWRQSTIDGNSISVTQRHLEFPKGKCWSLNTLAFQRTDQEMVWLRLTELQLKLVLGMKFETFDRLLTSR